MKGRVPKKLKKEPLIEAVWELRFEPKEESAGEILAGIIYNSLRHEYPKVVRLPAADIPRPIARVDPLLRYAPTIRLESVSASPFAVQIGDRVVSLNNRRPYKGWSEFSKRIHDLVKLLRSTELVQKPTRFSLRYIDLLELDPPPSLASLRVRVEVAERDLGECPIQLRAEIQDDPFVHILQIASPALVTIGNAEQRKGTLVDIDTIRNVESSADFWEILDAELDEAHARSNRLFFELLTSEALERLEPIYE